MVQKKNNLLFSVITILFVLVIVLFYGQHWLYHHHKKQLFARLQTVIDPAIKKFSGTAHIYIQDLSAPKYIFDRGAHEKVVAASVIKIPILATAYIAQSQHKLDFSKEITVKKTNITGGSGILKTHKTPFTIAIQELLTLMITQSDNTATNSIINQLSLNYCNKTFIQLGLTNTVLQRDMMDFSMRRKGYENYTSAIDVACILQQLYNNRVVNTAASEQMIELLKQQKINDRLPRYLPKNIPVAHKTGLERGVVHDAGIVFTPQADYIICVLTTNVKNYSAAKKFIATISRLVYEIYTNPTVIPAKAGI